MDSSHISSCAVETKVVSKLFISIESELKKRCNQMNHLARNQKILEEAEDLAWRKT